MLGKTADGIVRGDGLGGEANSGLGLDPGTQFEVAQRVETVIGERAVGVDGASQDRPDLLADQMPKTAGPFLRGQGAERVGERGVV